MSTPSDRYARVHDDGRVENEEGYTPDDAVQLLMAEMETLRRRVDLLEKHVPRDQEVLRQRQARIEELERKLDGGK